jgi:hypothetical protein
MMLAVMVLGVSMLASNAQLAKAKGSIWDLNGDGKVDGKDIAIAAKAFGSCGPNFWYPGSPASPNWNPSCDFDHHNQVDALDLALLAEHFGQADP